MDRKELVGGILEQLRPLLTLFHAHNDAQAQEVARTERREHQAEESMEPSAVLEQNVAARPLRPIPGDVLPDPTYSFIIGPCLF